MTTPRTDTPKGALREQIRRRIESIPDKDRRLGSARACELLRQQSFWGKARCILFYAALPNELHVTPLILEALAAGKRAALPRFNPDAGEYEAAEIHDLQRDCAPGKFNVLQPSAQRPAMPPQELELVLAPGVAFDETGHRLGRGQGYYDRLLARIDAAKCGVAFEEQIVPRIPAEAHDIRMNFILTPARWRAISPSAGNT